ncbi:MAG: polysaccharide biosynthesis/export family protein [Chlamydiota bacterium]|nr:polysaccharide biosynthesis/export family protein [Chlamydiota bacterium]
MTKIIFLILFLFINPFIYAQNDYQIGPEDVLEITVYEEEDLSLSVRVSPDGYMTYPLLGRIAVRGLSVRDLENKLTELLGKDYLVSPQVTIFVKEYSDIYVLGEVNKPGPYKLSTRTTIMKAIALAGGFTEFADRNHIEVIRETEKEKDILPVDLSFTDPENIKQKDISLKPKDVVNVYRLDNIYVLGQVNKPGEYPLKSGLTVVEAISLAGGFTKIAAKNKVKVIRNIKDEKKTFVVDISDILNSGNQNSDISLKPNDVVMIPESFF